MTDVMKTDTTRRVFLQGAAASVVYGSMAMSAKRAFASPMGLPVGLQLYSVRELLPKDYEGTLRQIAALGFEEVEAAGFYGHSPKDVRAAMGSAGLNCVSAHYSYADLSKSLEETIEFNHELGSRYIICSFPGFRDASRLKGKSFAEQVQSFTADDYRWNAEQFNAMGAKVAKAGMQFGYHNHTMEFRQKDGVVPYDELIRLTDPALVTFEMDCGWVMVGGGDPVAYLQLYPKRISMLHVKDFKHTDTPTSVVNPPPPAELGKGTMDYRAIFAAAKPGSIKHYFVEQEGFDMPPMEALQIDATYMMRLKV